MLKNKFKKLGHDHDHDCDDFEMGGGPKDLPSLAQSELSKSRIIFVNENITTKTATTLCNTILFYQNTDKEKPITLYINTNGGAVAALTQMYDVMQMVTCPIHTVVLGKAYSAGAWLLATGTKGERYAMKNSRIMIHGMQLGFPVAPDISESDSGNYIEWCDKVNHKILKILAKHTGQTLDKIKQDCAKDLFLTAEEALKYGLIDKII